MIFKQFITRKLKIAILFLTLFVLAYSCANRGIHYYVYNPKKPGKMPTFSEEKILLGELTDYRSCFDVYYYDLTVDFNPKEKSIAGTVEMYATAQNDFDTLQIDLHKNLNIERLVDKESGNSLAFYRKERAVFIKNPHQKDDKFILQIDYAGKPMIAKKPPWSGGFVWKKDKNRNHWDGVACESDGASIWWPLKDHTSDEPDSVRMHYTVPKGLMAIGNGQFEGTINSRESSTFNWFVSYPINAYNVTFYIGDFMQIKDEYTGINGKTLELHYYVLEKNYDKAKKHFKQVKPILKTFEEKFGEYPWYSDGYKLIESPYTGMEHQTAIAYGDSYENMFIDSITDYIILHETAHEWWGNSVTARDFSDIWLQEGFATYAESLFFEATAHKDAYLMHLYLNRLFIENKYPIVGVKGRRWFDPQLSSDVYSKGAWILHTLRKQIDNDTLFFEILKTFAENFKYQMVDSQDFIDLVNKMTNSDYSWFFNQYLYHNYVPLLDHVISSDGYFYYRWANVNEDFNKFKIEIESGNQVYYITPSDQVQKFKLPTDYFGKWDFILIIDMLFADRISSYLLLKDNKTRYYPPAPPKYTDDRFIKDWRRGKPANNFNKTNLGL